MASRKLLTRVELAKALGVNPRQILRWVQDGLPVARRAGRGRAHLFDRATVLRWRAAREADAADAGLSLQQERARKERAQAILAEQTFKIRERELLPRAEVERVWSQHVAAVRNRLLHLPQAMADPLARAATLQGPAAVEQQLREAIVAILAELAGDSGGTA